ncbi:MAG TPA: helix-turn-helix domain-containing protein [Nocardioidaceae bacterium]
MTTTRRRSRAQIARRLQTSVGDLTTAALTRMDRDMPWFRQLSAENRSWISLIVQAGINAFITWYRDPEEAAPLTAEVFGAAPRALTGFVSLHQTVEMVRLTIEVVEDNLVTAVGEEDAPSVQEAVVRYAREVAFATAEVYAKAAEMRGAWDARLEALVVDSVLRAEADETVRSRASALGWQSRGDVAVVLGRVPARASDSAAPDRESIIDEVRRSARHVGLDALCAVQGDRLVVVLGGVDNPDKAGASVASHFGDGPVVVGPVVSDLMRAHVSARAAVAGLRAAPGWPDAPRPVTADDLLPERALSGDGHARRQLVTAVYPPLVEAGAATLDTVSSFLDHGGSMEATARAMFVHANTVRYRLRRAADVTGLTATDPRDAYTYRVALTLGRLHPPEAVPTAAL